VLDWENLFKRYVWDDRTTPYLVPLSRLNRYQADNEILAYCLFLGILFGIVALTAMSGATPHGRSPFIAVYGITVVFAAIAFGIAKNYLAAIYLSATPLAGLVYLLVYGFRSGRHLIDTLLVTLVVLLLLWYSLRVIALARIYPSLRKPENEEQPRRRLFKR
jgi:hypothetical protein|tara:strand:- start:236 stop:721 length:486 start_codon:yes stop_codon:yes gene_type:complete